jgi:hypothetical protein
MVRGLLKAVPTTCALAAVLHKVDQALVGELALDDIAIDNAQY